MDPWGELVALAEREHALALDGRWEELAELSGERVRRAALLGPAPAAAREALERLSQLQAQITAALVSARAFTSRELEGLRRGRAAVRGYGAGAALAPAPQRVNGFG